MQLIIEAIIVGFINLIVGYGLLYTTYTFILPDLKKNFIKCNKYYCVLIMLFLAGVIIHLICEITKVNKWYCKNGYACKL